MCCVGGSGVPQVMSEAIKAMPQFKELLGKYSLHMDLTKKCMSQYETNSLEGVSGEEQNMSTGEDVDGNPPKDLLVKVSAHLQSAGVLARDKLRLLMIYVVTQTGVTEADVARLAGLAGFREGDSSTQALQNLRHLHVQVMVEGEKGSCVCVCVCV